MFYKFPKNKNKHHHQEEEGTTRIVLHTNDDECVAIMGFFESVILRNRTFQGN